MSTIRKLKIYSKSHLRRLARLETEALFCRKSLQAQQVSPSSSASLINIKNNDDNIDNNIDSNIFDSNVDNNVDNNTIAYISLNQDTENDDTLQSNFNTLNSIEYDNILLPESEIISTVDDDKTVDENMDSKFKKNIAAWSIEYGISHCALNALLEYLNTYTNTQFPKDSRTLLKTPRNTEIVKMGDGQYCHYNIVDIVKKMIIDISKSGININVLDLLINIDGMSISRSSKGCFWPILVSENLCRKVYVAGLYYGYSKPKDPNEFLKRFVSDIRPLITEGFINNTFTVKINLSALICDTPAKSFVLAVKSHTGFFSCTKCTIRGEWHGRICFPQVNENIPLRTDSEMADNKYMGEYQQEVSILKEIDNFGLVSCVPLDYMHLVCLGVMRKLISLWLKHAFPPKKAKSFCKQISLLLKNVRSTVPSKFNRRPRLLEDYKQWKATEFRTFLLYLGPIVLKNALDKDMYNNFLTLHVAISILLNKAFCKEDCYLNYAENLLKHFVKSFGKLYGKAHVSHNIHNLLHLVADVRKFGTLDNFSCFRFENYMSTFKKLLRKGDRPLQQLSRRFSEIESTIENFEEPRSSELYLEKKHFDGPLHQKIDNSDQYKILHNSFYTIRCDDKRNNCCMLKNGEYIEVENIIQCKDKIFVIGKELLNVQDLYDAPIKSSFLQINIVNTNNENQNLNAWDINYVVAKAWKIPYGEQFIACPLIHTYKN